jgi:hypothetical protein
MHYTLLLKNYQVFRKAILIGLIPEELKGKEEILKLIREKERFSDITLVNQKLANILSQLIEIYILADLPHLFY